MLTLKFLNELIEDFEEHEYYDRRGDVLKVLKEMRDTYHAENKVVGVLIESGILPVSKEK